MTRQLRDTAAALRALPAQVETAVRDHGHREVAEPMAALVRQAARGSRWHPKLASGISAEPGPAPALRLSTARPVFSGGASTRDVVPGALWGRGGRSTSVVSPRGRASYRPTTTTAQFRPAGVDYAWAPITGGTRLVDAWADLIDDAITRAGW